jgi:hypothetical protein
VRAPGGIAEGGREELVAFWLGRGLQVAHEGLQLGDTPL